MTEPLELLEPLQINSSFINGGRDIGAGQVEVEEDVDEEEEEEEEEEEDVETSDDEKVKLGNSSSSAFVGGAHNNHSSIVSISSNGSVNNCLNTSSGIPKSGRSRCTSPSNGIGMNTVINSHGALLSHHSKKTTPTKINLGGSVSSHSHHSSRVSTITNNSDIDFLFQSLKNSITSKNSFVLGIHRHRSISNTTTITSMTSDLSPHVISGSDINSDTMARVSAITITTNSDLNSSDTGAAALNQPSFNDLTTSCDTLTETDEEEELVESFLEDDDDENILPPSNHQYNNGHHQHHNGNPQHDVDGMEEEDENMIDEREFKIFQKQFLHHTNSSSSFIRTNGNNSNSASYNVLDKSTIGGSLMNDRDSQSGSNSPDLNSTSSYRSAQNSVIYKPSSLSSSSLISATPNSTKTSPYLSSPMVSPRLLSTSTDNQPPPLISISNNNSNNNINSNNSITINSNNNITQATTNQNPNLTINQNNLNTSTNSTNSSLSPGSAAISSSTSTSSTSLLSTSSVSSVASSNSSNSSPKPSKKSKSVFSKIIKEGTKRLVTKFSDKKDSDDELPSSYILVYRGNGDESWRIKINSSTTVKELIVMLSQPQFLKLYLTSSLTFCNCNNNQLNSPNCNINQDHHSNNNNSNNNHNVKCNNCNQMKSIIEKELNEDDKILYVQKKWISSGTTSTPPLFVLKSNIYINNSNNNNSGNNSISKNTQHNLFISNGNNSISKSSTNKSRYSVSSIASESSDTSNNSSHSHHSNNIYQQNTSSSASPNLSPWSSPTLISPTSINSSSGSSNQNSYNNSSQNGHSFMIPNLQLENSNSQRSSVIQVNRSHSSTSLLRDLHQNHVNQSYPTNSSSFIVTNIPSDQWKNAERPRTGIRWINSNDITLLRNIGSGSFSKVYKAKYMDEIVAVKILNGDITPEQIENFKKEYDVLSLISSPHLIKFYGACKEGKLKMVVEYCQYGSLYNIMSHNKRLEITWPLAFKWMRQAVEGINVLHTMTPALVHRDIKSQNLLINAYYDLKVADFGLAKPTELQTNSNSSLKGTMAYCAPELYSDVRYTEKSDVYSLGIVLWELTTRCLTGKYHRPYEDHTGIAFDFQIVIMTSKQGIRPTMPDNVPQKLSSLITKCWHQDPNERPNCKQLLLSVRSLYDDYISDPNYWNSLINQK